MPHQESPRPTESVAILGSCISMDNFNSLFNPEWRKWYSFPFNSSQVALAALMSEPLDITYKLPENSSLWAETSLEDELKRGFLDLLREDPPDYLMLDWFGDVHWGMARVDDGPWFTDNPERIGLTDWYQKMDQEGRITRLDPLADTDAYMKVWHKAAIDFKAYVDKVAPDTILVLNRGRNTNQLVDLDTGFAVRTGTPSQKVRDLDDLWRHFDDLAIHVFEPEVIDLTEVAPKTHTGHPWGASLVHYTPDHYHRFLGEMHTLYLRREADPEVVARVEEINQGWADQVARLEKSNRAYTRRSRRLERELNEAKRRIVGLEGRRDTLRSEVERFNRGPRWKRVLKVLRG